MQADFSIPEDLTRADYVRLMFHLRLLDDFDLTLEAFLRLRRGLLQAAQEVDRQSAEARAAEIFEPPLATDPVARRRFQRPAPAFVLAPPLEVLGPCVKGASIPLEVLFLGQGIGRIPVFAQALECLGRHGLFLGKGPFEVRAIDSLDSSGVCHSLWGPGEPLTDAPPMVSQCAWWLESRLFPPGHLCLEFQTPTRLLSNGRPLFEPNFEQVFPFILRRVTSMLYAHCGIELVDDPVQLLQGASEVTTVSQELVWEDWRTLSGRQDLGGILGRLVLEGPGLQDLLWVLHLGSLFQIGKGATYGAGSYRVITL